VNVAEILTTDSLKAHLSTVANDCNPGARAMAHHRITGHDAALRAALDAAKADLAAMTDRALSSSQAAMENATQLRAALARCAELEAQRDEARRMYCEKGWRRGGVSPREVCLRRWPAEADRLFPEKGGE
jgi:hypothetical protein